MAKAIIISHPSEIIKKGLVNILENEIPVNIILCSDCAEIEKKYVNVFSDLVVLLPFAFDNNELSLAFKSKTQRLLTVGIKLDNSLDTSEKLVDFHFSIFDTSEKLVEKINNFFSPNNQLQEEELTSREKEVLRLVALGHTNKSIADNLFISAHTVISHRKNITDKLGIKSIPGLTVYAIIQKIISQSDITKNNLL